MRAILYGRIKIAQKSKGMFILFFLMPLIFTAIFGGMGGDGIDRISVPYVDEDLSPQSELLIEKFSQDKVYRLREVTREEMEGAIRNNEAEFGLVIEKGYGALLGEPNDKLGILSGVDTVNLMSFRRALIDTVDSIHRSQRTVELAIETYKRISPVDNVFSQRLHKLIEEMNKREVPPISIEVSTRGQSAFEGYNQRNYSSVGFLVFFTMFTIVFGIGEIVADRRYGIWDRLATSPLSKASIYGGNMVYAFALGFTKIMLLILTGKFIFGIPWSDNFLGIILVVGAFALCVSAFGVLLSSFVKTPQQLGSIAPVILVSTSMLGGCYWPIEIVTSRVLLVIARFTPQFWAVKSLNRILIGNSNLAEVFQPVLILLVMGIVFFGIGIQIRESRA